MLEGPIMYIASVCKIVRKEIKWSAAKCLFSVKDSLQTKLLNVGSIRIYILTTGSCLE